MDRLLSGEKLEKTDFLYLLKKRADGKDCSSLFAAARSVSAAYFGKKIYARGLIEFTNYCRNDCYYCGIRRSNCAVDRYRLTPEEILSACETGYTLGLRTFVLQGGEDGLYTDTVMTDLIGEIKGRWPDCALTLSMGERSFESYLAFFRAGADRYLLRHETADADHYGFLHPEELALESRIKSLRRLRSIGYQTGTGFMVGSPGQTHEHLAQDLLFIQEFVPQMAGIGPFVPHRDTPLGKYPAGSVELTLFLIALLRLMLPRTLIPATTALGTLDPEGREKGILSGANVLMPNLSPRPVREKYALYDNKICTGEEAAESIALLKKRIAAIGYDIVSDRGDYRAG